MRECRSMRVKLGVGCCKIALRFLLILRSIPNRADTVVCWGGGSISINPLELKQSAGFVVVPGLGDVGRSSKEVRPSSLR